MKSKPEARSRGNWSALLGLRRGFRPLRRAAPLCGAPEVCWHRFLVRSARRTAMNASRRKTSAMLLAVLGSAAFEAQACGELMLRGLGTMRFHAFATHTSANILLYSGTAAIDSKAPAATDPRLYDGLKRVGHKVTLARGAG